MSWIVANGKEGDEIRFRSLDQGLPIWVDAPEKALQFARRCDAELFAFEDEDAWLLVEYPPRKCLLELAKEFPAILSVPSVEVQNRFTYPMLMLDVDLCSREVLRAIADATDFISIEAVEWKTVCTDHFATAIFYGEERVAVKA